LGVFLGLGIQSLPNITSFLCWVLIWVLFFCRFFVHFLGVIGGGHYSTTLLVLISKSII
jgi:hypothetical protein